MYKAAVLLLLIVSVSSDSQLNVAPSTGISLVSDQGIALFVKGLENSGDLLTVSGHFTVQVNQAFCGIATASIVFNSLYPVLVAPLATVSTNTSAYYYFDQTNILSNTAIQAAGFNASYIDGITGPGGLTLDQLAFVFESWGTNVQVWHANNLNLTDFRARVKSCLVLTNCFVTINFLRTGVGEIGGGHHSIIAGYNEIDDQMLVLDVAQYKYEPFWFSSQTLLDAANTTDTANLLPDQTRGILLVSLNPANPTSSYIDGIPQASTVTMLRSSSIFLLLVIGILNLYYYYYY